MTPISLAVHRVPHGRARARELGERLDVVLVAEHLGRSAALQRGADAVGADELLRVAEAGGQPDPVERLARATSRPCRSRTTPSASVRITLTGSPVELFVQVPEYRVGVPGQRGLRIGIAGVPQLDPVRRYLPLT